MDDITRERVWRKLQVLPDAQLFQVLDFIEFLEGKYAPRKATEPTGIQRFAERLQDRLRGRSVAPEYISGAVGILGMARRAVETGKEVVSGVVQTGLGVVDEVVEAGRGLLTEPEPPHPGQASLPAGVVVKDGTPVLPMVGEPSAELEAAEAPPAETLPAAQAPPAETLPAAEAPPAETPPAAEAPPAPKLEAAQAPHARGRARRAPEPTEAPAGKDAAGEDAPA